MPVLEEIPEDLASLTSADDVLALAGRIEQRMRDIAADAAADPDAVAELELLADAYRDLNTRATEIADEAAERARRAEAALAVLAPEPTASDLPPEPDPEETPAPEPQPAPQPQPEPQQPEPVQAAAEIQAPSTEMTRRMTASERRNAIAELRNRQNAPGSRVPAAPSAALTTGDPGYPMRASRPLSSFGMQAGDPFESADHLAQTISEMRRRMGRMQLQGRGFEYVGQMTEAQPDNLVTVEDDPIHNFVVLDNLQQNLLGRNGGNGGSSVDTLVASGALCAPFAPLYEFFRLAQPQNPVERSLPTVQAPRGGIRFIVPPDFRPARAGIGTRNATQNADPTTPDKPCVTVACPGVNDCVVQAVTECVRWDNLNFRAFPEQVAAFT
ncbi:MAG TPA: major capsid protein, partial [Acidimicrobiia bacterium]